MYSYLQNFYKNFNKNEDNNVEFFNYQNDINETNIPIGWSAICFDETINFYSDYLVKQTKEES
uniref:Uncharacterized protein n=1 Tax=Caloglossa beccarii TaxID=131038 RepID=A0A1Z1M8H2_9FLOR|nr:hypothetical protein [Caloglossa beccarii]ARW62259.1 hypothetical protein [Caloglossa beccarii]